MRERIKRGRKRHLAQYVRMRETDRSRNRQKDQM